MKVNDVRVRPAVPDDASAIAGIHVRTWRSAYRGLLPDAALSALSLVGRFRLWQRMLNDESAPVAVHVAETAGEIVGFCSVGSAQDPADQDPDISELFTIYVDPEHQDRGVGSRLLFTAEATMREWGSVRGVLWVLDGNVRARSFYARHGWSADGAVKTDTILGVEVHEARFRKALHDEAAQADVAGRS